MLPPLKPVPWIRSLSSKWASRHRTINIVGWVVFVSAISWLAVAHFNRVVDAFAKTTVDDSGITYAYADNLAHGHGLRLTPGDFPTEGFSNFLQVLLLTPVAALNIDLDNPAKWLNVGATSLALCLLVVALSTLVPFAWRWCLLPLFFLVWLWPGFEYWTAQGLEGGLVMSLQTVGLVGLCFVKDRRAVYAVGLTAGLLAWARPEAAVYGAILVFAAACTGWRSFVRAGTVAAALVVLLVFTRWIVFRDVVPNTYWAKSGGFNEWSLGIEYVIGFWHTRWTYLLCALPFFAFATRQFLVPALAAFLMCVFAVFFAVKVGGDWMHEWRFMQSLYGPLLTIHALGLVTLVGIVANKRLTLGFAAVVAPFAPLVILHFALAPWQIRAAEIANVIDASYSGTRSRALTIKSLGAEVALKRPIVSAEPDVGGMSYRSGIQVLDLVGLADRNMAKGKTHFPATLTDYFFGEARPDLIHLHGPWLTLTPLHQLPAFEDLYRKQSYSGPQRMEALLNEITDPLVPPVQQIDLTIPGAKVFGMSAVDLGDFVMLFAHGLQDGAQDPAPLPYSSAATPAVALGVLQWHLGRPSLPMRPGSSVLAMGKVRKSQFPLVLGAAVKIDAPPIVPTSLGTLSDWFRLPLLQIANVHHALCAPSRFVDSTATSANQVRGVAALAGLCRGLEAEIDQEWYVRATKALDDLDDPGDQAILAKVAMRFSSDKKLSHRTASDDARSRFASYDQVPMHWAQHFMVYGDQSRRAAMLLVGGHPEEALAVALAFGLQDPLSHKTICTAVRQLGLAQSISSSFSCSPLDTLNISLSRQSFEKATDPSVTFQQGMTAASLVNRSPPAQARVLGGHGKRFLDTFTPTQGDAAVGEVVWTSHAKGTLFGALLAGGGNSDATSVLIEKQDGAGWTQVGKINPSTGSAILTPHILHLSARVDGVVRVRVVDQSTAAWGHIVADSLTFIDLE